MFKIGEAFPIGDPVAVFLVSMSVALNDVVTSAKWMVGGDEDGPSKRSVSDVEQFYILRLSVAQVYEVRESVKHARKNDEVASFIDGLPESARADLDRLLRINTPKDDWILAAMTHVRNQASHYGGKWNWDDLEWAMKQVADDEGEIEMVSEKLAGLRLSFANHIANQHLTRKFPEYVADDDAVLDSETMEARVSTLFSAVADVTVAAQNFASVAIDAYLQSLPEGVVRVEI